MCHIEAADRLAAAADVASPRPRKVGGACRDTSSRDSEDAGDGRRAERSEAE